MKLKLKLIIISSTIKHNLRFFFDDRTDFVFNFRVYFNRFSTGTDCRHSRNVNIFAYLKKKSKKLRKTNTKKKFYFRNILRCNFFGGDFRRRRLGAGPFAFGTVFRFGRFVTLKKVDVKKIIA